MRVSVPWRGSRSTVIWDVCAVAKHHGAGAISYGKKKDGSRTWSTPRVQAAFSAASKIRPGDADLALAGRDERRPLEDRPGRHRTYRGDRRKLGQHVFPRFDHSLRDPLPQSDAVERFVLREPAQYRHLGAQNIAVAGRGQHR